MVAEAGCRAAANDLWIILYFLGYVIATTLGIALLRRFFVLRRESQRRAAGLPEPEPDVPELCKDCKRGQLIPASIPAFAGLGCWPAFSYLVLVVSILCSALLAPLFLSPYSSAPKHLDGRSRALMMVFAFLLLGWVPTIRTSVLICDNCQRRSYPRPPGLDRVPSPEAPEDENTEDEVTGEE